MSTSTTDIAFATASKLSFDEAVAKARDELAKEGFGVLTEIDVKATMKKKLGIDVEPYIILGACNPSYAHKALEAVPEVGVLLPCNVTVSVEGGRTVVRAMNPEAAMSLIDDATVAEVGSSVGAALRRVVDACRE
jgi:uncharacterized protein (DUF302 family)